MAQRAFSCARSRELLPADAGANPSRHWIQAVHALCQRWLSIPHDFSLKVRAPYKGRVRLGACVLP
jgi:hypothetical protein